MIKYMSYLFANVRKKWSTYIIPLFGALMLAMFLLPAILTNETETPIIGKVNTLYYFSAFVFGSMFVGTKTLNIFKDGEADGTELLIVSKPISRGQIILGKFSTLYLLIFGYALWSFITTLAIGFVDDNASTGTIFGFAGGYAIGSFIIMVIFSAAITFFASIMGKIGTLSLSIIIPAILPIGSLILVGTGNGSLGQLGNDMTQHRVYSSHISDDGVVSIQDPIYIYDDKDSDYKTNLKTKQDGFYKYIAYGDVWQHMLGFYSVIEPQKIGISSEGVKIERSEETLSAKDGFLLTDTNSGLKSLYMLNANEDDSVIVPSKMTAFFKLLKENNIGLTSADSGKSFYEIRRIIEEQILDSDAHPGLEEKVNDIIGDEGQDISYEFVAAYQASEIKDFTISDLDRQDDNRLLKLNLVVSDNGQEYIFDNGISNDDMCTIPEILKNLNLNLTVDGTFEDVIDELDKQLTSGPVTSDYSDLVSKYSKTQVQEAMATFIISNDSNVTVSDLKSALGDKLSAFDGNYKFQFDKLTIKKYLDEGSVVGIYTFLAILFSGLVIIRYFRRDFK